MNDSILALAPLVCGPYHIGDKLLLLEPYVTCSVDKVFSRKSS